MTRMMTAGAKVCPQIFFLSVFLTRRGKQTERVDTLSILLGTNGGELRGNEDSGCTGAPAIFFFLFHFSDVTWQPTGEGWSLPSSFDTTQGEGTTLPVVFSAHAGGHVPPVLF